MLTYGEGVFEKKNRKFKNWTPGPTKTRNKDRRWVPENRRMGARKQEEMVGVFDCA